MSEKESAPMAPIFQYSGHSDDEHECSDQEPQELDEEEGDVVVQEEESSVDGIPLNMKTVWETGKLEKTFHPQTGKKVWKCHFCNGMWSEWNHTKAVGHAAGRGRDITSCKMIPPRWRKVFSSFVNTKLTT